MVCDEKFAKDGPRSPVILTYVILEGVSRTRRSLYSITITLRDNDSGRQLMIKLTAQEAKDLAVQLFYISEGRNPLYDRGDSKDPKPV